MEVYVGHEVSTGEVDVFVTCLDVRDWLYRLVGEAILLENKWRQRPAGTDDISIFHDKASWSTATCKVCYFISMAGFTSERNVGSEQFLRLKSDPKMVGWTREDVERMVIDGTPKGLMRDDVM